MADVKVKIVVVRRTTEETHVVMLVDEDEDQWTTLERAAKQAVLWTQNEQYIDRFNSLIRVIP